MSVYLCIYGNRSMNSKKSGRCWRRSGKRCKKFFMSTGFLLLHFPCFQSVCLPRSLLRRPTPPLNFLTSSVMGSELRAELSQALTISEAVDSYTSKLEKEFQAWNIAAKHTCNTRANMR